MLPTQSLKIDIRHNRPLLPKAAKAIKDRNDQIFADISKILPTTDPQMKQALTKTTAGSEGALAAISTPASPSTTLPERPSVPSHNQPSRPVLQEHRLSRRKFRRGSSPTKFGTKVRHQESAYRQKSPWFFVGDETHAGREARAVYNKGPRKGL